MTTRSHRVCLVSPLHPANNPRLVKSAAALQAAGFEVTAISGRNHPPTDPLDAAVLTTATWHQRRVDQTRRLASLPTEAVHRAARVCCRFLSQPPLAVARRALHRAVIPLTHEATAARADLYIGHTPAGLAAAAEAARRTGARLGFDAEDFHSEETWEVIQDAGQRRALACCERASLPRCVHVTAASDLIGAAYQPYRPGASPVTVLNVFPRQFAPAGPMDESERGSAGRHRLYWFSQTIGPDRGLEPMMEVLARLPPTAEADLDLRGRAVPGFVEQLEARARAQGWRGQLRLLPVAPPDELVRLAAPYGLGLALEPVVPRNRDLCLTNKLFTYLLAGVPVALTPTTAQRALAPLLGPAGLLLELDRPEEAATALAAFLSDGERRRAARRHAWHLGQTRYHWEWEQTHLVAAVRAALGRP